MLKLENGNFSIVFNENGLVESFIDKRNQAEMTDGERSFGSISYTFSSDDITSLENKKPYSPYESRISLFEKAIETEKGVCLISEDLKAKAVYTLEADGGLKIDFSLENEEVSEYGINFPFNFSSKLKGGDWRKQFLFSSPYNSADNSKQLVYLTRPDGNGLAIIGDGNTDGWKMDYSPYIFGHFFINLKWLGNFDRAYSTARRKEKAFSVKMYPVNGYFEGLERLSAVMETPVATYEISSVLSGEELEITVIGECDGVQIENETTIYPVVDGKAKIRPTGYGLKKVYPLFDGGKKGADCEIFVYRGIREMFRKNLDHVGDEIPPLQFTNLCEGWTWVNTAIDYMRAYGKEPALLKKLELAKSVILTEDEEKARLHCTIWKKPHGEYPAYNVYKSNRIQEGFTGIWMMLDWYGLTKEKEYLDIALNMCENYLKAYQDEDGGLKRVEHGRIEEYTTVCAPLVPIVDVALIAEEIGDGRAEWFKESAKRIAEFLYQRQWSFPTEGGTSVLTQPEFEDGSISCTALSILYYCYKLEYDEKLVAFAEEVLKVHDAWEIYTDIAPMKNSSLRWWETCWKDFGPSLCCGHCWTIWRAEADFWRGVLKADSESMIRAYNGWFSNLSKQTEDGKFYGTYTIDYIPGGGFDISMYDKSKKNVPEFRVTNRELETVPDFTEARYCYNRMYHTWFKTLAIIGDKTLFGRRKGETFVHDGAEMEWLFVADYEGNVELEADKKFRLITKENYRVSCGKSDGEWIIPENGKVKISFT